MTTAGSTRRVDPPPRGSLFQETLRTDPFWMLVACSLVNLTTWEQAEPAFDFLRDVYWDPEHLALAAPCELYAALRPLGLWRRRALMLPRLASAWLRSPPSTHNDVLKLPGCGKYAADSWAIFVDGSVDVEPDDGKLNWYVDRMKERQHDEHGGRHGRHGGAVQPRGDRAPDPA